MVKKQTRGTVSEPASPAKKHSNASPGSRQDSPVSGQAGSKSEIDGSERATTSGKPREESGGAANHRHVAAPHEAGKPGNADQVDASGEKRLQGGRDQEASTTSGQQGMAEVHIT